MGHSWCYLIDLILKSCGRRLYKYKPNPHMHRTSVVADAQPEWVGKDKDEDHQLVGLKGLSVSLTCFALLCSFKIERKYKGFGFYRKG
jgi:hypothetical protein